MSLLESVTGFLKHPFPLWECELADSLVNHIWAQRGTDHSITPASYTTAGWLNQEIVQNVVGKRIPLSFPVGENIIYLEFPSFRHLQGFYDEHGLIPLTEAELGANQASLKTVKALDVISQLPQAHACIQKLVRSIQVVQQPEDEIDVSYSHPGIPFSIFVSLCRDDSPISNLRVAESILHETMHLKLTLIEEVKPLIQSNAVGLYFSPWRDELRPAQGVLHGLFVFRAIRDFYNALLPSTDSQREQKYLKERIDQINGEIKQLKLFLHCDDLTIDGAILTENLLPSS